MKRAIDKPNALGLTPMEVAEACIALQGTTGAVTIPGVGTITPKDQVAIAKIQAELRKPNKPGEYGKFKLPAIFKEIPLLAVVINQGRTEASRFAQYRAEYGLDDLREYLLPHEVRCADFVLYGYLGALHKISKQATTNYFDVAMRPQGDMVQLHRVCVMDAWRNHLPIPRIVIEADYPWLLTDPEQSWQYCHKTYTGAGMGIVFVDPASSLATSIIKSKTQPVTA